MCDQRTAIREGSAGAGGTAGKWWKGRRRGPCTDCGTKCRGDRYALVGLCWRCYRQLNAEQQWQRQLATERQCQPAVERYCGFCRRAIAARNQTGYCQHCSRSGWYRGLQACNRRRYRSPHVDIPPPEVDTTREERILYYIARAEQDLPLFSEGKYRHPNLK